MVVARRLKKLLERPSVDLSLKFLVIVSLALGLWATVGQWQLTRCQAAYNEASNKSQAARSLAATEDREALDDLIGGIVRDPKQGLIALHRYQEIRAQADDRRRRNPVPPPPSSTCG